MNKNQKFALWIGIIAFVLMGLYPPWCSWSGSPGARRKVFYGHSFIFAQPDTSISTGTHIDFARLGVQWAVVAVATGGLIVAFAKTKEDENIARRSGEMGFGAWVAVLIIVLSAIFCMFYFL